MKKSILKFSLLASVFVLALGLGACNGIEKTSANSSVQITQSAGSLEQKNANTAAVQEVATGQSLVIPQSELSETARFYPVSVDGVDMEVLAVKAPDGTVRTAFNTCEVCYDSGRGYYLQDGSELVCQNCQNRFSTASIEVAGSGCNPYPIFNQSKVVSDQSIEIPYDYLASQQQVFANWK